MPYGRRGIKRRYSTKRAKSVPARRKRTTYKRRYQGRVQRRVVNLVRSPGTAIPEQTITRMRYHDHGTLTLFAIEPYICKGTAWLANGLHDPYVSLGGHSALGFSQWSNFFLNYVVIGSKLTVNFVPSSGDPGALFFGAYPQGSPGLVETDVNRIIERRLGRWTKVSVFPGGYKGNGRVSCTYSPGKLFGITDPADDNQVKGATNSPTDPPLLGYYFVWACASSASANTVLEFDVTIDYTVKLTNPVQLHSSGGG